MVSFKNLSIFGLALGVSAQAQFGAAENSAAILAALQTVDTSTIKSGQGAAAYQPSNRQSRNTLERENVLLRSDWQYIIYLAQSSLGFYSEQGAQTIIDYINTRLYPDTRAADRIYTNKRNTFAAGGFLTFINDGLLQLRETVDAASAAVQAKTPASKLTNMTVAFTLIEQNYADTQETQMFGPQ